MPKNDYGNVIALNQDGIHSERVWTKTDELGNETDLFHMPISDNPNKNHGHGWNINLPDSGSRPPQKYPD